MGALDARSIRPAGIYFRIPFSGGTSGYLVSQYRLSRLGLLSARLALLALLGFSYTQYVLDMRDSQTEIRLHREASTPEALSSEL